MHGSHRSDPAERGSAGMTGERRSEGTAHPHTGGHVGPRRDAERSRPKPFEWGPVPRPLRAAAVRRLGWSALICAAFSTVFAAVHAIWFREAWLAHTTRYYGGSRIILLSPILGATIVVASIGLWWLTRRPGVDPQRVLKLGFVYQSVVAASLSFLHHLHGWEGLWIFTGW
jgi:hypothetical protein